MPEHLNEKPFEHSCRHGTVFRADRGDFVGGVTAFVPQHLTVAQMMEDANEMGAWHWANIVDRLNGYTGPPVITVVTGEAVREECGSIRAMPLMEFFTRERLGRFTNFPLTITRTLNGLMNAPYYWGEDIRTRFILPVDTVGDLVDNVSPAMLRRTPNFGRKNVALIELVLEAECLTLKGKV